MIISEQFVKVESHVFPTYPPGSSENAWADGSVALEGDAPQLCFSGQINAALPSVIIFTLSFRSAMNAF